MFLFLENKDVADIKNSHNLTIFYECVRALDFQEAIRLLATYSLKSRHHIIIFTNFFSVACRKLKQHQIRGLERIMLAEGALEISDVRYSRFINHAKENTSIAELIFTGVYFNGIGNLNMDNILIVGDTPGRMAEGLNVPFVGSGCGEWLLKTLDEHQINESDLYWINSRDQYRAEADPEIIEILNPRLIVALGTKAKEWLDKHLTQCKKVIHLDHPQYWRRFKSKDEYPLIKTIKEH